MTETLEIDWEEAAEPPELRINLRDYQQAARAAVQSGWAKFSRQLLDMATGTGKTSICSIMARDRWLRDGGRTLVLENRDALVRQTAKRLSGETGLDVDIEMAGEHASPFTPIVVASVQTLCRTARLTGFADDHFQQVIGDECLPCTAMIEGKSIADVKVGDSVLSYNHKKCKIERRKVLRLFKNPAKKLIKIYSNDRILCCTEAHPIFSISGYRSAGRIKVGDFIAHQEIPMQGLRDRRDKGRSLYAEETATLQAVPNEEIQEGKSDSASPVQAVRSNGKLHGFGAVLYEPLGDKIKPSLLLNCVQGYLVENELQKSVRTEDSGIQQENRWSEDANEQSNAHARCKGEDGGKENWQDVYFARRERTKHQAADFAWCYFPAHETRAPNRNSVSFSDVRVPSNKLQGGPSGYGSEVSRGGGRINAQAEEMEILGQEENRGIEFARVDRVEILERGSGLGYSEVCPDDCVYNFEVEGNNNYFANGILVHNCHHSLAKSWAKVFNYFHYGAESLTPDWKPPIDGSYKPKCDVLGVTATPELSSNRNLGEFYQTIAYRYQLLNAVKDGWLVMPRAIMEPLAINFNGLRATRTSHGSDYNPTEVAERMVPVIEALASRMAFHAAERKGMAFMPSVKTAEMLADALNRSGLRAIFVSGECLDRDEKTEAFVDHSPTNTGQGIMLCTAALYTEGFDVPDVDFVFAGITKSRSYYRQKIGRATRPLKGTVDGLDTAEERRAAIAASAKPNFLIYDPFCKCDEIELCDAYDLVTDRPEIKERMKAEGPLEEGSAEKAERDFIKSLEKEAKKHAAKKSRTVDPLAWAVSLGDSAISSYTPKDDWESHPASVGQLDLIKRFGFNIEGVKTKGIASRIIARLNARASMHLATPKQLHLMHQLGLDEQTCATLTQAEATATIDRMLAAKRERGALVPNLL